MCVMAVKVVVISDFQKHGRYEIKFGKGIFREIYLQTLVIYEIRSDPQFALKDQTPKVIHICGKSIITIVYAHATVRWRYYPETL